MDKPVFHTGTPVNFLDKEGDLGDGHIDSFDSSRGIYKIRTPEGHLVSVPSDLVREAGEYPDPPTEEGPETPEPGPAIPPYVVKILSVVSVVALVVSAIFLPFAYPKPEETPKAGTGAAIPKTEAETLYERLNHLNAEDAKEWGACGRQEARKKEKDEILKRLNSLK